METFLEYIAQNPDYIALVVGSAVLVYYAIKAILDFTNNFPNNDGRDDDGGIYFGDDEPILDLPPGVCLPRDVESEINA